MKYFFTLLSFREINSSHRLMTLIIVSLGLLNFFFGEIVPANDGLGWDGVTYANMTRYLYSMISEGQLNTYYAQRFLPSAIVRGLLYLVNAPFSNSNIIHAFALYNLALLVGASWAWKRIANHFSLSLGGRWLGFSGIFLSYAYSKQAFYYPVLTDVTALFIGMLLLIFYVEKRPFALLAASIIGAFAWQLVSLSGAILLIFMETKLPINIIKPATWESSAPSSRMVHWMWPGWLIWVVGSLLSVMFLMGLIIILEKNGVPHYINDLRLKSVESFITGLPSLIAVIFALAALAGSPLFFRTVAFALLKAPKLLIVLAAAAILIPRGIVQLISNPLLPNPSGLSLIAKLMLLPPEGKILLPLVTHLVFWGPMVILLLIKWKAFCIEARKIGPGFVAIIALSLPLCLVTEPRFITCAWSFFVLGVVLVMEKSNSCPSFTNVFTILTLLFAQFWMKINLAPWKGEAFEDLDKFPKQIYFMHHGLWMNWWSYSLQLITTVLCIIWIKKSLSSQNLSKDIL